MTNCHQCRQKRRHDRMGVMDDFEPYWLTFFFFIRQSVSKKKKSIHGTCRNRKMLNYFISSDNIINLL